MKLRLFPLLSLLISVILLVQGTPLPAEARTEPETADPSMLSVLSIIRSVAARNDSAFTSLPSDPTLTLIEETPDGCARLTSVNASDEAPQKNGYQMMECPYFPSGTIVDNLPSAIEDVPPPPLLISPSNNSQLSTLIPALKINTTISGVETSVSYQYSVNSDFGSGNGGYAVMGPGTTPERSFELGSGFSGYNLLPSTRYYWHARTGYGNWYTGPISWGPYSPTWSFTTGSNGTILTSPELASPANNSDVYTLRPTLQWRNFPGTQGFYVSARPVGGGAGYGWYADNWSTESVQFWTNLPQDSSWDWRVRLRNDYAWGDQSSAWRFTVRQASISGRIADASGNGIAGVTVVDNAGHSSLTDSGGNYTLSVQAAGTYTILPSKVGYTFVPSQRSVSIPPYTIVDQDFAGTFTLSVSHIEITQATQDEGNNVSLIAGKPTFVRVYVDCGEGCSEMPGVTGILRAYGASAELPQSPKPSINNSVVARHEDWRNQRGDLSKTLNFSIPQEWTSGTVTLRAEVSGATRSEPFTFVEARQPNVIYVPVHFDNTDPSSRIDDAFSWARKNWPTSRVNYLRWPVFNWSPNLLCRLSADCLKADLKTKLTELYWQGQVGGYIFGWLANGMESQLGVWGSSDPAWNGGYGKAAFGVDHPIDGPVIFTHEMAHLMGRHHPDTPDSCVPGIDPNSDWPHDNARIQQWGLDGYGFGWLIGSASVLKDPATNYDYMSYCWVNDHGAKPTWTSPWTFQRIYQETLRPTTANFALQPLVEPTPYFALSGLVFSNATVTLNPVWIITPMVEPDNPPVGVDYCLETQDATSAVLASRCFDLSFVDYDTGAPTEVRGFNLALPYSSSVKRLVLRKGTTELAAQIVSDHAPNVDVVSPNGSETWAATGTYTITWTASDLDGDLLTYSVLYSPDGNNWVPVGTAITATQLAVNAADLAGGAAARVRVMATDGVNTSSDESDATFTVWRKAPNAFILAPEGDVRFMPGTPLWLQGYGYDLEDGTLEGTALRWRSDRDGDLGTGSQALVTLSPGQHVITLLATDSNGNTATARISVFAGGRVVLPLTLKN